MVEKSIYEFFPEWAKEEDGYKKYAEYLERKSFNPDGTYRVNEDYQSILEVAAILKKKGIPHELNHLFDGWIIDYPNAAESKGDVIQHWIVPGATAGNMEAYGFGLDDVMICTDVKEALRFFVRQYRKDRFHDFVNKICPFLKKSKAIQEEKEVQKVCQEYGIDSSDVLPECQKKETCAGMKELFPPEEEPVPNWKANTMNRFTKVD